MVEKLRNRTLPASTQVMSRSPLANTPEIDERDPLDLIAEEFAEQCRRGKTPSVTDFIKRYPAHADDLADLLPAVGQMESLKRMRPATGSGAAPFLEKMPERIGDYRIIREIGRGGMGVVFEAEQSSLGRKVALKILPVAARTEKDKRDRFLREAQAMAKLHHTNIVPVFGVGEDHGIPYYVMQCIRGCGLDDILHGWKNDVEAAIGPHDWRAIARTLAKAADALDYAHSEGVLHRDVKPANLLIDASGHVWVTDFGLAKLLDEATQTATGHVLGTFQYMAPEALKGQSDARTDVYGLGMTLYELITGKLPFEETNPAALVKLIGEKEPPSPRSVNARIPKTLETICLKAIAREPSRRYQSAAEFAEDLRAYIVGRPIAAKRVSVLDRGLLWCRRNPLVAGLSAAIVLTLAISTYYGWSLYAKAKRALNNEIAALNEVTKAKEKEETLRTAESKQRQEAEAAGKRYRDNLDLSLDTLSNILDIAAKSEFPGPPNGNGPRPIEPGAFPPDRGPDHGPERGPPPRFGEGGMERGPGNPRERALSGNLQMINLALAFYEKFAAKNELDPKLKLDAAKAYHKIGELYFAMGNPQKGQEALGKSRKMLEELRRVMKDDRRVKDELDLIDEHEEMRRQRRMRMDGRP